MFGVFRDGFASLVPPVVDRSVRFVEVAPLTRPVLRRELRPRVLRRRLGMVTEAII